MTRGTANKSVAAENPFDLSEARRLRNGGMTWDNIGARFGVSGEYVHRRLDPEWAVHRQAGVNERRRERANGAGRADIRHMPEVSAEAKRDGEVLLRQIPPDTRDMTSKICGDPLPGRSALSQKSTQSGSA